MKISSKEIWFIVGSQHLYGPETLEQVQANAKSLVNSLNSNSNIPLKLVFKQVVTSSEEIWDVCSKANNHSDCIGLMTWMHTFSPAKMWIKGISRLSKPLVHLHTQFNLHIPWEQIDMDFMNLNQSAHGDREFGHLLSRIRKNHKIIVGHWSSKSVVTQLGNWMRAAMGWNALQNTKVARFGDNMREVAVTEGDKVEAEFRLGCSVNGFGVGDLVSQIDQVNDHQISQLIEQYVEAYQISDQVLASTSLQEAARIELGLRGFMKNRGFNAFTNTFEDLHGLSQLPGLSVQRMMADGYGFGAEGDWKTAALLRSIKVMDEGLKGGSSFMEDYTYHFEEDQSLVLGSHMLEICPSLASNKPKCEVHPLSIGGKADPARLIFEVESGPAINLSLVDIGNRFRLVVNHVLALSPKQNIPKLPVARVLWRPEPSLEISAQCWLLAGGAHHTVFSKSINVEIIEDLAEMAGIELLTIDEHTEPGEFKRTMQWNEAYYHQFQNNL